MCGIFRLGMSRHLRKSTYMSDFKLSRKSKHNRDVVGGGVDSKLAEISDLAITICPIDFGHGGTSGKRTAEAQNELYKSGVSPNCDGYKVLSRHQSGQALDFYAYVDGKASWDRTHLTIIAASLLQAASILGYKLSWGGFWQSKDLRYYNGIPYGWDCPHVELID